MKPGVSLARTAVCPICWPSATSVSATSGRVSGPAITSTTFIRGTGLKKWKPATRSGCCNPAASAVTDREDVLLARMQPGETQASSSASRARLACRFSTMASTTTVQLDRSARLEAACRRATAAWQAS